MKFEHCEPHCCQEVSSSAGVTLEGFAVSASFPGGEVGRWGGRGSCAQLGDAPKVLAGPQPGLSEYAWLGKESIHKELTFHTAAEAARHATKQIENKLMKGYEERFK